MSRYDQNSDTSLEPNLWCWNAGFLEVKLAQLQQSGFSCGKTCSKGSVPSQNCSRNGPGDSEPFLTPAVTYLRTLFLLSANQNCSFLRILIACHKRCGRVLTMDSLSSSLAISPQCTQQSTVTQGFFLVIFCTYTLSGEAKQAFRQRNTYQPGQLSSSYLRFPLFYSFFCKGQPPQTSQVVQ